MVKLTSETLYNYFSFIDTGHNHTPRLDTRGKLPFSFFDNGKKNLLVTIGDSWTWGDDITYNNDNDIRLEKVYGRLLSSKLSADWLNLGQCGSGNFWIAQKVQELSCIIEDLEYDHIYVICTLTEIGRAFNSDLDREIDYITWFKKNSEYNNLLKFLNDIVVQKIVNNLSKFKNVIFKIGTNFVTPIGFESAGDSFLSKSWLEVYLQEKLPDCFFVRNFVFQSFNDAIDLVYNKNSYIQWLDQMAANALDRRKILENTTLFRNYHPLPKGHEMWAQYVFENLRS